MTASLSVDSLAQKYGLPANVVAGMVQRGIQEQLEEKEKAARAERYRRMGFTRFMQSTRPKLTWDRAYLPVMCDFINQIVNGDVDRGMIFAPPRHGKTTCVCEGLPEYWKLTNPGTHIIAGSHSSKLAKRSSRRVRENLAPIIGISTDKSSDDEWEDLDGGSFQAIGVGSGIHGYGGHLILIDDPVRSREEAHSPAYRDRCWNWYDSDIYSRLEPGGKIVYIQTRWHPDDLAGRIMASLPLTGEKWAILRLPAICEDQKTRDEFNKVYGLPEGLPDPAGRVVGEPLCPERYNAEYYEIVEKRNIFTFMSMYQQAPPEKTGNTFKREWFRITRDSPLKVDRVRYWDPAATKKKTSKFTAGVLMSCDSDLQVHVEHLVHDQVDPGGFKRILLETARMDREKYGEYEPRIYIEREGGSAGVMVESDIKTMMAAEGFRVEFDKPTGAKIVRASPWAGHLDGGNAWVVKGAWNSVYVDEHVLFSESSTYVDIVDASSGAYAKLTHEKLKVEVG